MTDSVSRTGQADAQIEVTEEMVEAARERLEELLADYDGVGPPAITARMVREALMVALGAPFGREAPHQALLSDIQRLRGDVAFLARVARQFRDVAIAAHIAAEKNG